MKFPVEQTVDIPNATTIDAGLMSAEDKEKLDSLEPGGGVTEVTAAAPLASSGGDTPEISLTPSGVEAGSYTNANITVDEFGRVTEAEDGAGGGITAVTAAAPLSSTGGSTPEISLDDTAVTPGSYTNPNLTIDAQGRVTAAEDGDVNTDPLVMEFPDSRTNLVDHGFFWPSGDLTPGFLWEAWVMWTTGGQYLISDGYGGAHALLWGHDPSSGNPTGNVYTGSASVAFGGDDAPESGEWHHFAVGWSGDTIWTFINGVAVGKAAFAGPRQRQQGTLLVAGSNHQNWSGRIAQMRGTEGYYPLNVYGPTAFAPERFLGNRPYYLNNSEDGAGYVAFLADYMTGASMVPDHSPAGYNGRHHPGRLVNYADSGLDVANLSISNPQPPFPRYVRDPLCPLNFYEEPASWGEAARTPASVPSGAVVFDSFERRNNTWAHSIAPELGETEGGSAGALEWEQADPIQMWGILYGKAVLLSTGYGGPGGNSHNYNVVTTEISDVDVSILRRWGGFSNGQTGITVRYADASNNLVAYCENTPVVVLEKVVAGTVTSLGSWTPSSANWNTLRVVADGSTIKVYADSELLGTVTETAGQTNVKHGLASVTTYASQQNSLGRYDDFLIKEAP